jgi:lipid II:glycine glycyltransferase (peptidoglycan interpeptide bridge formation enzyme)
LAILSETEWEEALQRFPQAHILQLAAWGKLKAQFGWKPLWVANSKAGAQILFRKLPLNFSIAYIPKGPLGSDWTTLWPEIDRLCREQHAILLQVEPDAFEGSTKLPEAGWLEGFKIETDTIQPRRSSLVNLSQTEEEILAAMKQKTRYNIRLAEKKGVTVQLSKDLKNFHRVSQVTAERDGFFVHSQDYYQKAFQYFAEGGHVALFEARLDSQALAYLMLFINGERAWYFYGASDDAYRNLMPAYLLQWEAMRYAKARGATLFDLWGVPDEDEEKLESDFMNRSDGLWGVYRFKRGFSGRIVRSLPAYIKVYNPLLYKLYQAYRNRRKGNSHAGD